MGIQQKQVPQRTLTPADMMNKNELEEAMTAKAEGRARKRKRQVIQGDETPKKKKEVPRRDDKVVLEDFDHEKSPLTSTNLAQHNFSLLKGPPPSLPVPLPDTGRVAVMMPPLSPCPSSKYVAATPILDDTPFAEMEDTSCGFLAELPELSSSPISSTPKSTMFDHGSATEELDHSIFYQDPDFGSYSMYLLHSPQNALGLIADDSSSWMPEVGNNWDFESFVPFDPSYCRLPEST